MLLAVAVPAGVLSAVAYGVSAAVQHETANTGDGRASASGLRRLLHEPRWWMSIAGDTLGIGLQLLALAFGPVVLVQPLFVLCLLVALPVRRRLGGPPVTRRDIGACLLLVAGLALLFALLGDPGAGRDLPAGTSLAIVAATAVVGVAGVLAARPLTPVPRAVAWSVVTGACFGVEAVLVNVVSQAWRTDHWNAFTQAHGLVPLVGLIVIGLSGFALSLAAFQIGSLGSSFPAMLVVDPLVAVLLGATVLAERVSTSGAHLAGYAACLAAIVLATVLLANPAGPTSVGRAVPDELRGPTEPAGPTDPTDLTGPTGDGTGRKGDRVS